MGIIQPQEESLSPHTQAFQVIQGRVKPFPGGTAVDDDMGAPRAKF